MQASEENMTQNLLAGGSLRSHDGNEIEFVRVVHDGVDDEHMQQVLEEHSCDIVSVDTDGPDPVVVLDDMHALLGVLLSRHHIIPLRRICVPGPLEADLGHARRGSAPRAQQEVRHCV